MKRGHRRWVGPVIRSVCEAHIPTVSLRARCVPSWVIGGQPMIGKGWRMLMECLAAGRSISLPSSNTGMAKLAAQKAAAVGKTTKDGDDK